MTVQELIDYLDKLPKDTVVGVVYQRHSDYEVLQETDLAFFGKLEYEREAARWTGHPFMRTRQFVLRGGRIMEYDARTWPEGETPVFVPILMFPGN